MEYGIEAATCDEIEINKDKTFLILSRVMEEAGDNPRS
jgi:hypothetical protein